MWPKLLRSIAQALLDLADRLEDKPQPLKGLRFWIDEGHGGKFPGAVSPINANRNDTLYSKESDMNLAFCDILVPKLNALGAKVFRTRVNDSTVELTDRTNKINAEHKLSPIHLCLSIHYNAHNDVSVSGIETFYHPTKPQDRAYANAIQARLIMATGAKDRGVKVFNFHMVREPICPALLVELGFITNAEEEVKLHNAEYRMSQIEAIIQGIVDIWALK